MGRLDILVNNAGIVDGGTDVEALPVEKFREVMNVNVVAVFHCMQKAVAIMRRHGDVGKIVNIGSVRSHWTEAGEAGAYNASKFALRGLSETVARLLIKGKSKIAVGMVCPGIVDTPIHDHWSPAGSPSRQEWLKPETVAEAVLHAIKAPENVNIMDTIVVPTMQAPF
jgi:NAD(P)-dependent dehydrogenase (short-subunit alcohol dehydrogenase family)